MIGENAAERAKWEVLWVRERKIQRKDCGDDLVEAMRIRDLAIEKGRSNVTLRCKNFGFAPPEHLRPSVVEVKRPLSKPQIVRIGGKRYKKTHEIVKMRKVPLKQKNAEGIWWCPYCMKLRRFKESRSFVIEGVRVQEKRYVCPMCSVSHRDHSVRKHNPIANRLFYETEEAPKRRAPRTKESRKKAYKKRTKRG